MHHVRHGRWGTHIVKANPQLADDIADAVAELGPTTLPTRSPNSGRRQPARSRRT